jgi:hypothetical protein
VELDSSKCPLCGYGANAKTTHGKWIVPCDTCGHYSIDHFAYRLLQHKHLNQGGFAHNEEPIDNPFWESRYLLSAMTKERYEKERDGQKKWLSIEVGEDERRGTVPDWLAKIAAGEQCNLTDLISEAKKKAPRTRKEKMGCVMRHLYRDYDASGATGFQFVCTHDYPLFFLKGPEDFKSVIRFLKDEDYIDIKSETFDERITLEITSGGCKFSEGLGSEPKHSDCAPAVPSGKPNGEEWVIHSRVLDKLDRVPTTSGDVEFLVRVCGEINFCFSQGHTLATLLVMRALLNYVPPIFGHQNFAQVAAHSPKSVKKHLENLEEGLRSVADYQTHRVMKRGDCYPSPGQVEPFKLAFELLIEQVIQQLHGAAAGAQQP